VGLYEVRPPLEWGRGGAPPGGGGPCREKPDEGGG